MPQPLELAQVLGELSADQQQLLDFVATTFATRLPAATKVQRKGLFNRGRAVAVRVHVGAEVFALVETNGLVEATVGSSSGGIALTPEVISTREWSSRFSAALRSEAGRSTQVREALRGLC